MKLYVAGPMSNIPQFNIPAFDEAAAALRVRGYVVVSPAELDDPAIRAEELASVDGNMDALTTKTGESWGEFLARDVKLIADAGFDGVVVLKGWETSRGARLETFVANRMQGIPVYQFTRSWVAPLEGSPAAAGSSLAPTRNPGPRVTLRALVTAWTSDPSLVIGWANDNDKAWDYV